MRLLLTSAGLTNASISKALFDMVGKKPGDTSIVYIPTASNYETGSKEWVINNLNNISKQGFKEIRIADISAVPESVWRPQLESSDVLFFEGGSPFHLMESINSSGLKRILPDLLKTKVWVGLSAGSMVTNPDMGLEFSKTVYGEDIDRAEDMLGLSLVNFCLLPHLNSEYFPKLTEKNIRDVAAKTKNKIYAIDDQSAIKVVDGKIEVVSEGKWFEMN